MYTINIEKKDNKFIYSCKNKECRVGLAATVDKINLDENIKKGTEESILLSVYFVDKYKCEKKGDFLKRVEMRKDIQHPTKKELEDFKKNVEFVYV